MTFEESFEEKVERELRDREAARSKLENSAAYIELCKKMERSTEELRAISARWDDVYQDAPNSSRNSVENEVEDFDWSLPDNDLRWNSGSLDNALGEDTSGSNTYDMELSGSDAPKWIPWYRLPCISISEQPLEHRMFRPVYSVLAPNYRGLPGEKAPLIVRALDRVENSLVGDLLLGSVCGAPFGYGVADGRAQSGIDGDVYGIVGGVLVTLAFGVMKYISRRDWSARGGF